MGFPVALKIEAEGLRHKTDIGGVHLGLADGAAVGRAHDELMAAARTHLLPGTVRGVLVQKMAPPGVELLCGARLDPDFGYVITVGLGGVFTEVLRDAAIRLVPVERDETLAMLRELRAFQVLVGARGRAACDIEGIAEVLQSLCAVVTDYAGVIQEVEINPLIAPFGGQPLAVDTLIIRVPEVEEISGASDETADGHRNPQGSMKGGRRALHR
jgi:hypothetical protein